MAFPVDILIPSPYEAYNADVMYLHVTSYCPCSDLLVRFEDILCGCIAIVYVRCQQCTFSYRLRTLPMMLLVLVRGSSFASSADVLPTVIRTLQAWQLPCRICTMQMQ